MWILHLPSCSRVACQFCQKFSSVLFPVVVIVIVIIAVIVIFLFQLPSVQKSTNYKYCKNSNIIRTLVYV